MTIFTKMEIAEYGAPFQGQILNRFQFEKVASWAPPILRHVQMQPIVMSTGKPKRRSIAHSRADKRIPRIVGKQLHLATNLYVLSRVGCSHIYTNDCVMRNSLHIETVVDIPFNLHCIDPDKFSHRKLNVFPRSELAKQLPSYNTYGQLIRHFCHTQNLSTKNCQFSFEVLKFNDFSLMFSKILLLLCSSQMPGRSMEPARNPSQPTLWRAPTPWPNLSAPPTLWNHLLCSFCSPGSQCSSSGWCRTGLWTTWWLCTFWFANC